MAKCKDCVHVEACSRKQKIVIDGLNRAARYAEKFTNEKIEVGCSKEESLCELFCDRSRFVELPNDFPKGRLTTNKPLGNFDALMNYAYAKDGIVLIRYANNQENMDLCDYIAHHAKCDCAINAQEVLDGACLECDDFYCPLGRAYFASVQAAELRKRLKMYEDLAEQALKEREANE